MKALKPILDYCFDFINEIDDFTSLEISTDFSCYPNTNEIFIAVLASQNAVDGFIDNLYTRTDIRDISVFTWSLLHEVGHCETWYLLNKRTEHHCNNIKRKINRGSINPEIYYTLTDERIATDWAIRFVEQNHDYIKKFDRQIQRKLDNFYKEINLEDE